MTSALAAIPGLLLLTLCYAALCAVSPFGNCRKCRGFGYRLRTDRRGRLRPGRTCRRCHGERKRLRIGRHLYNHLTRLYREGTTRKEISR